MQSLQKGFQVDCFVASVCVAKAAELELVAVASDVVLLKNRNRSLLSKSEPWNEMLRAGQALASFLAWKPSLGTYLEYAHGQDAVVIVAQIEHFLVDRGRILQRADAKQGSIVCLLVLHHTELITGRIPKCC